MMAIRAHLYNALWLPHKLSLTPHCRPSAIDGYSHFLVKETEAQGGVQIVAQVNAASK